MNNNFPSGRVTRDVPCARAGKGAVVFHGDSPSSIPVYRKQDPAPIFRPLSNSEDIPTLPNPDAAVSCPPASDSTGSLIHRASEHETAGRSAADDWRIALHESGHVITHLLNNNEICGVTIVPDGECAGRTWGAQGAHAAAVWNADSISHHDISRHGDVGDIFFIVQKAVIGLMGGCAAEMVCLDGPPKYIASDVPSANRLAGLVCRNMASVAAFIEHGYQEAQELVEQHKTVVQAIAQALIDHPKRTLDSAEIDAVIAPVLAAQAAADEHKRRADWIAVLENANTFTVELES
jgi:hypothetical protein